MIISFEKEKEQIARVFSAADFSADNAARMADVLATADARGVYSHGMQMIPLYMRSLRSGCLAPNPEITVVREDRSSLTVDGGHGLGGISLTKAVDLAVEKARATGSCVLSMVNTGHYGAGAYYVERAAGQGMIAYLYGNTPGVAAPFGGAGRYIGTNPYSFAAPAGRYGTVVLDMATTVTAAGKLLAAINDGEQVSPELGVDREGKPCTDPEEILWHGALSHFGGPKGYGIAFMINVVTGVLSGGAFRPEDLFLHSDKEGRNDTVSFFMVLTDIAHFMPVEQFEARAEDFIADIKKVRPAKGFSEVCYPGEIERRKMAKALEEGVMIHDAAYENFLKEAAALGVSF